MHIADRLECLQPANWGNPLEFFFGNTGSQQIQHIYHADAHTADARSATALFWVESDPIHVIHRFSLAVKAPAGEPELNKLLQQRLRQALGLGALVAQHAGEFIQP